MIRMDQANFIASVITLAIAFFVLGLFVGGELTLHYIRTQCSSSNVIRDGNRFFYCQELKEQALDSSRLDQAIQLHKEFRHGSR